MRAVSDAGPLIHLSWIERLDILPELFEQVLVPAAVRAEVLRGGTRHLGAGSLRKALSAPWLSTRGVADQAAVRELQASLGAGEAEGLVLATEAAADLFLVDDRRARAEAARRGLVITGTIGLLRRARDTGLIDAVYPALRQLHLNGFRVGAELVEHVRREER